MFAIYLCSFFFSLVINSKKNNNLFTNDFFSIFYEILPAALKASIVFGSLTILSIWFIVVPVCAFFGYLSIFFVDIGVDDKS